ncbi:MAG: septal ring lytic transglycosylase RlpA family protein [Desulfobacterales bacterium]|nr:MAG: septal ring lytic transglycosylase RlpA family protein [Desulfobacterales bacterium]
MTFRARDFSLLTWCRWLAGGCVLVLWLHGCTTSAPPTPPPSPPAYPKPYKALGKWYQPLPDSRGFRQRGLASWYGADFHGKKTSSGEIYNMHALTAAHKTLPLGTYVRVRNLDNHRQLDVRVNDRGPFVRGRIIDLSYAAAHKLAVVGPGTAPVEIVALGTAAPTGTGAGRSYLQGDYYSGNFSFQVGAFLNRENAERLKHELTERYPNAHITPYDNGQNTFYRVRVGKCATLEQAVKYEAFLIQNGFQDAFAVAE